MISLGGGITFTENYKYRFSNNERNPTGEGGEIKNNISPFLASLESGDYEELFLF